MVSRLHLPLSSLLAALLLGLVGCSSDSRVCEVEADGTERCYYCDGLGCRPIEADCESPADCDDGEDCIAGLCQSQQQECTDDTHCDGELQCVAGTCRGDEAECTEDADCDAQERCSAGACRAEEDLCQFNHECGSHRICIDGRCMEECADDPDCDGEGQVCDEGLCRCDTEGCVEDDQPQPFCTAEEGCQGEGVTCVDGVCRTVCDENDPDAAEECQRFDVQFEFCLDGYCATTDEVTADCELSADCEGDQECINGNCL